MTKLKPTLWLFCLYVGLLVLASMRFSMVSWIWGERTLGWDAFLFSYESGWGADFRSDFSLGVVLVYLVAFLVGLVAHLMAGRRTGGARNIPAIILCALGVVCFAIEGSHWLWEHGFSFVAVCPAMSLLLAFISIILLGRDAARPSGENTDFPRASA